jgi:hypothetical protein
VVLVAKVRLEIRVIRIKLVADLPLVLTDVASKMLPPQVSPQRIVVKHSLVAKLAERVALERTSVPITVNLVLLQFRLCKDLQFLRKHLSILDTQVAHCEPEWWKSASESAPAPASASG